MRRGKSLFITSLTGALLALLASSVSAGEIGVCPPYSKTFGPEDPPESILGFIGELNARPGGGTLVLEPGTYSDISSPIAISGVVCIRAEAPDEPAPELRAGFQVDPGASLTLRSCSTGYVTASEGALLFAQGAGLGNLSNAGSTYAEDTHFGSHVENTGVLIAIRGEISGGEDTALDNAGYAYLDGILIIRTQWDYKGFGGRGIGNGAGGIVSLVRSTVADNGYCCDWDKYCNPGDCGRGGIDNTEGGYVEIAQSIVANNSGGDCFGPIEDLGYNVFGPEGGCTVTTPTSIEEDPNFVVEDPEDNNWTGPELGPGSPAIDLIPLDLCPETDALGRPRTDGNGDGIVACDAGALEFAGTGIVVKSPPFARDYGLVDLSTDSALYVVFMSSAALDPATIDAYSVVLGETGAVPRASNLVDRNGDGVLDLRLRYKLKDVPLVCGEQTLTVSAVTTEGETVSGLLKLEVTGCPF